MNREKFTQGQELASLWTPALEQVRQQIQCQDSQLFSALVAFAGIHMNLWPLWLKICREKPSPKSSLGEAIDITALADNNSPWLCLVLPYGGNAAMMHLQAPGVSQERKLIEDIRKPAFSQLMRSLDAKGIVVGYNKGIEILYSLGHTYANNEPLRMPLIHWQTLLKQWPFWQNSIESLEKPLREIIENCQWKSNETQPCTENFQSLAAGLWQGLQDSGTLQCAQRQKSSFNFLSLFKKDKSRDPFLGNLAFYGDHQAFWDEIQESFGKAVK